MITPHISIRVDKESLERWQENCDRLGTNVSSRIRLLMDSWCDMEEERSANEEILSSTVDIEKIKEEYGISV